MHHNLMVPTPVYVARKYISTEFTMRPKHYGSRFCKVVKEKSRIKWIRRINIEKLLRKVRMLVRTVMIKSVCI